ncbi:OPT/YSL family transporter [Acidobacteriota bacterium]
MKKKALVEEYKVGEIPEKHPSVFEPQTLILGILLGFLGIIIGLELLTRVGITANTSIIAAIIAIAISRIPLAVLQTFRSLPRQNLIQTVISGATFGGANAVFLPMGILWLLGKKELIPAMMIGAIMGLLIDSAILYKVFDSKVYPAEGIWPPGVATAECIIAGDKGGKRAKFVGLGGILGAMGRLLGIPMDIFGVCWIGNIWALSMFSIGLLVRGYSPVIFNIDINKLYVPHGVMIGAGLVAMAQIIFAITKKETGKSEEIHYTIGKKQFRLGIERGYMAFIGASMIMAIISGLFTHMSLPMLIGFILFSATAALISELIVGISAMHAGWFPSFATSLIFLILGMLIGFPQIALALLTGFTASTGPAFADMAYDLKAGWILRGRGKYPEYEKQGRRQQYYAELLGFAVAIIVIGLFYENYFSGNLFPPVDKVFASTIRAETSPEMAKYLIVWAIPGAVIQFLGGSSKQIGILFATGLLIMAPTAGWTALVALVIRFVLLKRYGESVQSPMYVLAGGFIAGSALCSFGTATLKLK